MLGKKFYIVTVSMLIIALTFSYKHEEISASVSSGHAYFQKLSDIIRIVNGVYVEKPDNEKMMNGAIRGMLEELDPHSAYISAEDQKEVTEEFNGEFGGIGIQFEIKDDFLTVITSIPDTPSDRLGLQPGDRILKINDQSALGITTKEVFKVLKGEIGSKVKITISREGVTEPLDYEIIRAAIPVYSVVANCMLDDKITGYVAISRFARKTAQELEEALQMLEGKGMKQLILDLRGNGGGLMDQAIAVADKFIEGGKKIVFTRGRLDNANDEYFSTDRETHRKYPIIILIDEGTASASEIVSGALQDHDRALILGSRSFGKGLVQRPYELGDGSVVRITIARYYTPTGRLIQRPYDNGITSYYLDRDETNLKLSKKEKLKRDSVRKANVFYTLKKKRKVYGGGGIMPDSVLAAEHISSFLVNLYRKNIFQDYSIAFYNNHKNDLLPWQTDFELFYKEFDITAEMLTDFMEIADSRGISISTSEQDEEIVNDSSVDSEQDEESSKDLISYSYKTYQKNSERLKKEIKIHISRQYFKNKSQYPRVRAMNDEHIKTAISLFGKARELSDL